MTAPVAVTAEEFVVHVFIVMDGITGDRPYELALRLWRSLRPLMGHPAESTGLPADPPQSVTNIPDELADETVLAVQQSHTGDAQAVLRRRHDVLNLSVLFTGGQGGWREFERRWDLVVDGVADSLLGEVRIYYGLVTGRAGALPATSNLAASVAERLPAVTVAEGWEHEGVTTATGFPLWELSLREDGRRMRRLLALTPETHDDELSSWVWSDTGPHAPRFARYLGHAAKLRHQVRLWNRGRRLRELRTRVADAVAGYPGQARAVELDLASALTALAAMRRTVEIAADNMSRMLAGVVTADDRRNLFTDDRSPAADAQMWLDDEAEYLRLDRDLLREFRDIASVPLQVTAESPGEPLVGLLTAMPIEFHAMRSLLEDPEDAWAPFDHAYYVRAVLPSMERDRPHRVVLVQTGATATNAAADGATNLLRSFPSVTCLIMVGVAAGVPAPADPQRHVRLGDVVVATWGLVDYAHVVVREGGATASRATFPRPWPYLNRVDAWLEAGELEGLRPWEQWLDPGDPVFLRPPDATDRLASGAGRHPRRMTSGRRQGRPKIHRGRIGSADISVRDAGLRDRLAAEHDIRALEMEGAGVGTSAFLGDRHWYMIRGVSDYADSSYNSRWRPYASLAAAAYVRALLAASLPFDSV